MSVTKNQFAPHLHDSDQNSASSRPPKSNNAKRTQQLTDSKENPQKKQPGKTQKTPGKLLALLSFYAQRKQRA
jgi:hypothetical protein